MKAENKLNWQPTVTDLSMTKTLMTLKTRSLEFNAFRQILIVATNLNMKYSRVGCQMIIMKNVSV